MVTLICATHRPKNVTHKIVLAYQQILQELGQEVRLLEMSELPENFIYADTFGHRTEKTQALIDHCVKPADKMVVIAPEYNGSFPGVFKAFLDGVEPPLWKGKKVALVGVASGRAGNLRGMDHLTHILHYLKMEVFSNKVPISKVNGLLNEEGQLDDPETLAVLRLQAQEFLSF